MGFDVEQFQTASFSFREESIPVPELKDFFGEGEEAVWKIRNLTGIEVFAASEAMERNRRRNEIMEGLMSEDRKEVVAAVKELAGYTDKAPDEYVRRLEVFRLGSVDPKISKEIAVKIADSFSTTFTHLTNRILVLTGLGKEPGK
jgi:hypothetical protein